MKRLALRWSGYVDFNQGLNAQNGKFTTGVLILVYSIRVYTLSPRGPTLAEIVYEISKSI